jgi:hypothetical protein
MPWRRASLYRDDGPTNLSRRKSVLPTRQNKAVISNSNRFTPNPGHRKCSVVALRAFRNAVA